MAPAKGAKAAKSSKRVSQAPPPAEPKKPRLNPLMKGVLDAIHQAEGLPDGCREMLVASMPGCLGTPAAERHECQAVVVTWIAEVIDSVRVRLQKAMDAAEAENASALQRAAELERQMPGMKAALERVEVASKERGLHEAAKATLVAEAEAQKAEEACSARLAKVGQLEAALKLLSDGAQDCVQELLPVAQHAGLEESLLVALPSAASKAPGDRTTFDNMVLERLEVALREHIPALEAEAQEHKGYTEKAKAALDAAKAAQQSAHAALELARRDKCQAQEALARAEADQEALAKGRAAAEAARAEKQKAWQDFIGYNVECFVMLRDKAVETPSA